jgi:hypothetical protein
MRRHELAAAVSADQAAQAMPLLSHRINLARRIWHRG